MMTNDVQPMEKSLIEGIKDNAGLTKAIGVCLLILGILAVAAPLAAGASLMFIIGIMLIMGGGAQCVLAFKAGAFGRGLLVFLMGALTLLVGIYMIGQPVAALASITLFLAFYFVATGIVEIVAAFNVKPAAGWGGMLFNAIVTLLLGVMIWRQFPLSGIWAVGVLFGVKLISSGMALIALGAAVKKEALETLATK